VHIIVADDDDKTEYQIAAHLLQAEVDDAGLFNAAANLTGTFTPAYARHLNHNL
jgi:hypothetical protein